jgi:hypothetical protein
MDDEYRRELIAFFDDRKYRIVKTTKKGSFSSVYTVEQASGQDALGVETWLTAMSFAKDGRGKLTRGYMSSNEPLVANVVMHVIDLLTHTLTHKHVPELVKRARKRGR